MGEDFLLVLENETNIAESLLLVMLLIDFIGCEFYNSINVLNY